MCISNSHLNFINCPLILMVYKRVNTNVSREINPTNSNIPILVLCNFLTKKETSHFGMEVIFLSYLLIIPLCFGFLLAFQNIH